MDQDEIKNYIIKVVAWGGYFAILANFVYANNYLANLVSVFEVMYWLISIILLLAIIVMFVPGPDERVQKMAQEVTEKIREKPMYSLISKWVGWAMVVFVGVIGDWSLFTILCIMNCMGVLLQQQAMNIVTGAISGEYDSKSSL